jgi:hypothetical protein
LTEGVQLTGSQLWGQEVLGKQWSCYWLLLLLLENNLQGVFRAWLDYVMPCWLPSFAWRY